MMRRRDFISLVGGAAAWPLAARAQQGGRMRRIGVLMGTTADDPIGQARIAAFLHGLQQLGWTDGRNVRVDARWGGSNADNMRKYAAELVALAPDVILAHSSAAVAPQAAGALCRASPPNSPAGPGHHVGRPGQRRSRANRS